MAVVDREPVAPRAFSLRAPGAADVFSRLSERGRNAIGRLCEMDEFDCWVLEAQPLTDRLTGPVVVTMLLVPRGDGPVGPGRAFSRQGRPGPAFAIDIEPRPGGASRDPDGWPQALARITQAWPEPPGLASESGPRPFPGGGASSGLCRIGRTTTAPDLADEGPRRLRGLWHRVTAFLSADFA